MYVYVYNIYTFIYIYIAPHVPGLKTAAIRRTAVRQTGVSRHYEGPVEVSPETSRTSQHYRIEGLMGAYNWPSLCRETLVSQITNVGFVSLAHVYCAFIDIYIYFHFFCIIFHSSIHFQLLDPDFYIFLYPVLAVKQVEMYQRMKNN